jgi:hypothetical protein
MVCGNLWQRGSQPGLSLKTPSCILFDPTQNFHSFGSDAEDKYIDLHKKMSTLTGFISKDSRYNHNLMSKAIFKLYFRMSTQVDVLVSSC